MTLATHDAGGVTERDVELAAAMDRLAEAAALSDARCHLCGAAARRTI